MKNKFNDFLYFIADNIAERTTPNIVGKVSKIDILSLKYSYLLNYRVKVALTTKEGLE